MTGMHYRESPVSYGALIASAMRPAGVSLEQSRLHYLSIGDALRICNLDAYLYGRTAVSVTEHDVAAHAVNELLSDLSRDLRATYLRAP